MVFFKYVNRTCHLPTIIAVTTSWLVTVQNHQELKSIKEDYRKHGVTNELQMIKLYQPYSFEIT